MVDMKRADMKPDMKRFRAAVIGSGFMGRTHVEALRRLGTVDVTVVASGNAADLKLLLADPSIDVLHICTPNALHFEAAAAALEAGKHVISEKPLATCAGDARKLITLARERSLRHATNHNLRYYPMVQQMRAMREAGAFGEVLVVQGTYSQDWLLYETDWNWRVEARVGGPSRVMADIGSHWCDMAEHVTGLRITSLCADLQTFHKTRKQPAGKMDTFQNAGNADRREMVVDTEDFGSVQFHMGERTRGAFTASQVSAGRKNRLVMEIYGTKGSAAWDQERPDELWTGSRDSGNGLMLKDPSLMAPAARSYADFPGGHSEGYDDTFKQLFRRFYQSVADPLAPCEYPLFDDGLRQLVLVEAELESNRRRGWVEVSS